MLFVKHILSPVGNVLQKSLHFLGKNLGNSALNRTWDGFKYTVYVYVRKNTDRVLNVGFLVISSEEPVQGLSYKSDFVLCGRSAVWATWSPDARRRGVVSWGGPGAACGSAPTGTTSSSTSGSRHDQPPPSVASGKIHLLVQPTSCSDFRSHLCDAACSWYFSSDSLETDFKGNKKQLLSRLRIGRIARYRTILADCEGIDYLISMKSFFLLLLLFSISWSLLCNSRRRMLRYC
jgi:hypothetical protein